MKERPKGASYIHEVEGDNEIIVVIPTADYEGKYARNCRNNIFNGLHMIFVESGENPDPYFNYSHNCNVGIRKALEYDPKWVVISNDDVKTERIENLINLLQTATENYYVPKNTYSNTDAVVLNINKAIFTVYALYKLKKYGWQTFKRSIKIETNRMFDENLILFCKPNGLLYKVLIKFSRTLSSPYKNFADFGIFKAKIIGEHYFDEKFINGHEDGELCIRLANDGIMAKILDFSVKSLDSAGNTLGKPGSIPRTLRDFSNLLLLSYILSNP
ncbi:MAG: glycosyltransferase family protein [Thermoplasmataceae archaeon]